MDSTANKSQHSDNNIKLKDNNQNNVDAANVRETNKTKLKDNNQNYVVAVNNRSNYLVARNETIERKYVVMMHLLRGMNYLTLKKMEGIDEICNSLRGGQLCDQLCG